MSDWQAGPAGAVRNGDWAERDRAADREVPPVGAEFERVCERDG